MLRASSLAQQLPRLQLKPRWNSRPFFSSSRLHRQLIAVDDVKNGNAQENQVEEERQDELYILDGPSYQAGRAWRRIPVPPIRGNKLSDELSPNLHPAQKASLLAEKEAREALAKQRRTFSSKIVRQKDKYTRKQLLIVLGSTNSISEAWNAYTSLLALPQPTHRPHKIPPLHLHRLAFLLASERPKTRALFLQMISVLNAIRATGKKLNRRWWNSLIDMSARGWRGVGESDYRVALQVFADMIEGREPGETFIKMEEELGRREVGDQVPLRFSSSRVHESGATSPKEQPDLSSFNTLINIAVRTKKPELVQQATSLLTQHPSFSPNRITHLSLLNYFGAIRQLSGVRTTIFKMREQNLELGLDGLNACMWAYGQNDRIDVVVMIYRLLRHNSVPEVPSTSIDAFSKTLKDEERITVPPDMHLNEITFHQTVQILAYAGDFKGALGVFADFLSTKNTEVGAPLLRKPDGTLEQTFYLPTMTVYRAIFLGFARHGVPSFVPPRVKDIAKTAREQPSSDNWNWTNLLALFNAFMTHPPHEQIISRPTIYWIIVGFARTTDGNRAVLRYIWSRLEGRWPGPWGGNQHRLVRIREQLFKEEGEKIDHSFFLPDFEQAMRDKNYADSMLDKE